MNLTVLAPSFNRAAKFLRLPGSICNQKYSFHLPLARGLRAISCANLCMSVEKRYGGLAMRWKLETEDGLAGVSACHIRVKLSGVVEGAAFCDGEGFEATSFKMRSK